VTIQGVRGPIGRLGLRRGDVITHVNDVEWNGTAKDLQDYIYDSYVNHPNEEISMTVNANIEIATFLWIRHEMLLRSRGEL
jgi:S1-C subfamily serine protease